MGEVDNTDEVDQACAFASFSDLTLLDQSSAQSQ